MDAPIKPDKGTNENLSAVFRVREVARTLQISDRSARRLIASGELPSIRIGRCRRVSASALAAFIAKGGA
jgi:excisionase family DNA binding protein